jgi:hypothetical protein
MNLVPNQSSVSTEFHKWSEIVGQIDELEIVTETNKNKKTKRKEKTLPITTDRYGIRVQSTYTPTNRPTYKEWVKEMGINELTYQTHPDGQPKAEEITKRMGTVEWFLTPFERLTGIRWH